MSEFHRRSLVCPICATGFSGWLVLPQASGGPVAADLRRFPEGEDPLPRMLNGCPGCAYTGEVSAFEEHAPAPDKPVPGSRVGAFFDPLAWQDAHDPLVVDRPPASTLRAQLQDHLAPRAAEAHASPSLRWEHHAQVVRWIGEGPLREGDAWLRAAWMYDDAGADDEGSRCRSMALRAYRQGIDEQRWFARREDLVVVAYLVGELHRRRTEAEEARKWFDQAITWAEGLPRLEDLVALAMRQRDDPREVV
jgi:uncharacterized protein (DUF2225 family)